MQPGDKLWYVPNGHGNEREVTVKKVGRVWFTVNELPRSRFSIDVGYQAGGEYSSPGRCWASKNAYNAYLRVNLLWRQFRQNVRYDKPEGVTEADIRAAAKALGITLTE